MSIKENFRFWKSVLWDADNLNEKVDIEKDSNMQEYQESLKRADEMYSKVNNSKKSGKGGKGGKSITVKKVNTDSTKAVNSLKSKAPEKEEERSR